MKRVLDKRLCLFDIRRTLRIIEVRLGELPELLTNLSVVSIVNIELH